MNGYLYAPLLLVCVCLSSCGNGGCRVTYDHFAVITNALSLPATVEFRPSYYEWPVLTRTIGPGRTDASFTRRNETRRTSKGPSINAFCGDDDYEMRPEFVEFSNATLAQYTVCWSDESATYEVLASGATCTIPYPLTADHGW